MKSYRVSTSSRNAGLQAWSETNVEDLRLTASSTQTFRDTHLLDAAAAAQAQTKDIATVAAQTDLWIFRDGCRQVPGPAFVRDLACRISQKTSVSDALIQAGELEAALADAGSADADAAAELTDVLAHRVCTGNASESDPADIVGRITVPDLINISPPEGFTYYALHPLDFAKLVARIPGEPRACAIIGIRSIGTTLSAIVAAQLWASGRAASRITVRPTGHPYARTIQFTAEQASWIDSHKSRSAQFLIVDEGPGRSGSTFLSVAEALLRAGVPPDAITIMGSRRFDPDSLCAESAAARWRELCFL